MLYAILCYHDEDVVGSWSKRAGRGGHDEAAVVQDKLAKRAGSARWRGCCRRRRRPRCARTDPPLVIDGPFAETKEQLLGFYVVDCANLDEALDVARELARGQSGRRLRIRPGRSVCNPGISLQT